MKKEDTLALKGVAIIMMLMYHLFYVKQGGDYYSLLNFSGMPLIKRFSEICYPVPLYVMLSGYGLYASFSSGKNKQLWRRALLLYLHLWIIYLLFLPLGCFLIPDKYPGGVVEFLKNIFSISCSYNAEQWFLLPYLILMLCSKPIFKLIDRIKPAFSLMISFIFEVVYLYLYRTIGVGGFGGFLGIYRQLFLTMGFILPFVLGALARKGSWVEEIMQIDLPFFKDSKTAKRWMSLIIIFGVIGIRLFVPNQTLQILVVFLLLLLFPCIGVGKYGMVVLQYLGKHSMNIWLIHTWICYYLFKDFIYGLSYPILIFAVTLLFSLMVSWLVEGIYKLLSSKMSFLIK